MFSPKRKSVDAENESFDSGSNRLPKELKVLHNYFSTFIFTNVISNVKLFIIGYICFYPD